MPEGTRIVGERTLAWRASQGNVALWIPDDVVLLGSGQVLANKINENPVGTLLMFPKDKSPTAVIISMNGMDPDATVQLNQAAHAAQKAEALDEDKWKALTHHPSHNGLHAEAREAKTFAQALIAIKEKALPGEQAGDNALRAALGASGGHPQLRMVGEQRHEEESRSAIRQAMAELLEEADPERFDGLVKARNTLLPPDQIQITSYWADDLAWLADEKLRQFISQYPVLSTSLFGACLLGDERAQAITDQIRASASTKKAAAAWVQTSPGSGSPKGSNSPPNWWNGAPPGPVENPRASQDYILPALQKIQQVIEGDAQRTGVCVQRLATCDCLASRTMPHLAMMVDKPENIETLQKLLMSGMMAGAPFSQLSADLKSLTPKHHEQIRSTDFIGRWQWFSGRMIRDLSQIMAWRLTQADPHERPAALCRGLAVDHPDGEDIVHLADRVSRKLEQRLKQLPLTQKLKMVNDHMEFEAAPGATGGMAQTEQISNWAVAAGSQGLPLDGEDVPNRWIPLLNKLGRERLAKDLDGLGQATELFTAAQLAEEGSPERLDHCVGSYAHYCRKGDSSVWHLQANDSKRGSTLEIRVTSDRSGARLSTAQYRGHRNCSPTEGEERLAKTLLASLRQTIANETKLRDEVSVRRAERNIRMTEALPAGYADVIHMITEQAWVLEDQSCAGFLCSEPAVRLGIPLPLENLTCDLQRRNRIGLYVEKAMSRSNTNQAIRLAAETGNMETLFKSYINRNDDRRITTEMFFEKYRPWLPRAMSGPDLLAATWNIGGYPEEFQEVPGKELVKLAVDRGRAWREERQVRLAILTAQADPDEAPEEQPNQRNAAQRRRQRRQIAMGDRLGGEALGLGQPLAGNLGRGRRRAAPEAEQEELQVMPAEAVVEAAEAAPM